MVHFMVCIQLAPAVGLIARPCGPPKGGKLSEGRSANGYMESSKPGALNCGSHGQNLSISVIKIKPKDLRDMIIW